MLVQLDVAMRRMGFIVITECAVRRVAIKLSAMMNDHAIVQDGHIRLFDQLAGVIPTR